MAASASQSLLRAPVRGRGASRRRARVAEQHPLAGRLLRQLTGIGQRLLAGAVLLSLLVAVVHFGPRLQAMFDQPVGKVEVSGDLLRLDTEQIRGVIAGFDLHSLIGLDLPAMRESIEALEWIRFASVRRVWPDTLQVRVVEQTPIAVWNDAGLINDRGQVFHPQEVAAFSSLPQLHGPEGSGQRLMQEYQRFAMVLQSQGLQLRSLWFSPRGAWDVELTNGIRVRLGRDEALARLQRFARLHHAYLGDRLPEVAEVDARYERGLAVRWRPAQGDTTELDRQG